MAILAKSTQRSEIFRKIFPVERLYKTESNFYMEVFPLLAKLQEQENYWNIPRCFLTNTVYGNEYLVLEDLKNSGYKMCDRKMFMTPEHVKITMRCYGKFHGLSFVARTLHPGIFKQIVEVFKSCLNDFNSDKFKPHITQSMLQLLEIFHPEEDNVLYDKLQKFAENASDIFVQLNFEEGPYDVVVHGDSWCNNIFFKYTDDKPTEAKLIDFQFVKLGNLLTDLSLFLYTSCSKEQLDDYQRYLRIYYESFSKVLNDFGCNAQELYPFDLLLQQYPKYCRSGLIRGSATLRNMLKDVEEVKDFVDIAEESGGLGEVDINIKNLDVFFKRIKDVIIHVDQVGGLTVN